MPALKIPGRYRPGFVVLATLSDSSFDEFLTAAKHAPANFSTARELELWLGSEVTSISPEDLTKLVDSITSFFRLRSKYALTAVKLAADLAAGARESISGFLVPEGVDFEGRLAALLGVDAFGVIALKAKELQTQAERVFVEARVLTDIRPIFGEDVLESPTGMIIVHTLKIVTHEGTGHKEFFAALDAEDITALKKTLERAEEKAKSLKGLLDKSGLKSIDLS